MNIRPIHIKRIFILISLILATFLTPSLTVNADQKVLHLHITDLEDNIISEINENEDFKVSVYILDDFGLPEFLIDVDLAFNNMNYVIDGDDIGSEQILSSPEVEHDKLFFINVSKTEYQSNFDTIMVIDSSSSNNHNPPDTKTLIIEPEEYVINANSRFSVKITENNEFGTPVADVTVAIQNYFGSETKTNNNGRAFLTAPEDRDEIIIIANKSGYIDGQIKIEINKEKGFFDQLITNKFFPIFLAIVILLLIIIYVNHRQKKATYINNISKSKKDISKDDYPKPKNKPNNSTNHFDKDLYPSDIYSKEPVRVKNNRDSRIEEIRISRSNKEREVVPVKTDRGKNHRQKKKDFPDEEEWFKGTDDMRYEIDKMTGKIDEKGKDKWYEGIDDIRHKIDEVIKGKKKEKEK